MQGVMGACYENMFLPFNDNLNLVFNDYLEITSSSTFAFLLKQSNSRIPSLIGPGNNSKAAPKKISVGQKKPPDALGSSPPPSR